MQQQHTGNVENSDRDLIYSLFELSLPFNISPTSASTDIDSMLPRASLPHSRSISSDSMLGFVRKGHPSLDLYRSNQLLQQSEPRSTPKPSPPFDRDSLSTIPSLLSHSRSISSDSKLDFVQQVHPSLDLPNTGASKNSDDREQQRVVSMPTDCKLDSSVVGGETMIRKRKSKSMIQGKDITISDSKLTNVGGDYHEHIYVIEEASTCRGYLDTIPDMLKKLDAKLNSLLNSSPKEDNTKSIDSTMHSPSRVENENMSDTGSFTEIHFNSLNDPPPTPVFDDGYCIYQTPTPRRINNFTPNSPSGNQNPYPFGYLPVLVPGIVHYSPCWLPSWGGWIASWFSWMSPPTWMWPSFL